MRYEECSVGLRVVATLDGSDVGVVESGNERDRMVWVRFPIPGRPSQTALEEFDPEDLEVASDD